MAALVPSTYLPYIANTAAVIGCIPTALGISCLLQPLRCLQVFEFEGPSVQASPHDRNLVNGFIRLFAARDLAVGITTLTIWYNHCRGGDAMGYRTLGTVMMVSNGMVLMDGLVSRWVKGSGAWKHWGFIPVNLGISAALLGLI